MQTRKRSSRPLLIKCFPFQTAILAVDDPVGDQGCSVGSGGVFIPVPLLSISLH